MAEFRFAPEPTEEEWGGHVDDLETLLCSLVQAGWELPESYDSDFDSEHGAFLFGELHRTGMVISIQYEPSAGKLQLLALRRRRPASAQHAGRNGRDPDRA